MWMKKKKVDLSLVSMTIILGDWLVALNMINQIDTCTIFMCHVSHI